MNNHYGQLVAGLESIAHDAAGIESFDQFESFENRINLEVQRFKALDEIGAGIESSERVCLKDINELEKAFPGIMYNDAMINAHFTINPSASGVTAALEAIDWKKAGKWGLIGAIVAAIIAIIYKIVGGKSGDSSVAEAAIKETQAMDASVVTHARLEVNSERMAKETAATSTPRETIVEFDKLTSTGEVAGQLIAKPTQLPTGKEVNQHAYGSKQRAIPIPPAVGSKPTSPPRVAAKHTPDHKPKIHAAAQAFSALTKHLEQGSSYDFKNAVASKKWIADDVRKRAHLMPEVRSLDAWASVRSTFLWSTDQGDMREITTVFKALASITATDPKHLGMLKDLTTLVIELKGLADTYISATKSGHDHQVKNTKANVDLVKGKIAPLLAALAAASPTAGGGDLEQQIAHAIDLIRPSSAEAKRISDSRSKLTAPTVKMIALTPIISSIELIKKHGNEVIPLFKSVKSDLDQVSKSMTGWDLRAMAVESGDTDEVKRQKAQWKKDFSDLNNLFNKCIGVINTNYHGLYAQFGRVGKVLSVYRSTVHATKQLIDQDVHLMQKHMTFMRAWAEMSHSVAG